MENCVWGHNEEGRATGPSVLCVCLSVPATGSERRLSEELNCVPALGALSVGVSPPPLVPCRGRPDNSKVSVSPCPQIGLHPRLVSGLTPLCAPQD